MSRALILRVALLATLALIACDTPPPTAEIPSPPTSSVPPPADQGAAKVGEAGAPVDGAAPSEGQAAAPAGDQGAPAGDEAPSGGEGGGLLPDPDFALKVPELKAPEGEKPKNLLGGEGEGKPKLLDVDLKGE